MKAPRLMPLDREDRRALAALAAYGVVLAAGILSLLALALTLALCVRLFVAVSGVG